MRRLSVLLGLLAACDPDEILEASARLLAADRPIQACEVLLDGTARFPRSHDLLAATSTTCTAALERLQVQAAHNLRAGELYQARATADQAARLQPGHSITNALDITVRHAHLTASREAANQGQSSDAIQIALQLTTWRPADAQAATWASDLIQQEVDLARDEARRGRHEAAYGRLNRLEALIPGSPLIDEARRQVRQIEASHHAHHALDHAARGELGLAYLRARIAASRDSRHGELPQRYLTQWQDQHDIQVAIRTSSRHRRAQQLVSTTRTLLNEQPPSSVDRPADLQAEVRRHPMQCTTHVTSSIATHHYISHTTEIPNPQRAALQEDLRHAHEDQEDARRMVAATQRRARRVLADVEQNQHIVAASRLAHEEATDAVERNKQRVQATREALEQHRASTASAPPDSDQLVAAQQALQQKIRRAEARVEAAKAARGDARAELPANLSCRDIPPAASIRVQQSDADATLEQAKSHHETRRAAHEASATEYEALLSDARARFGKRADAPPQVRQRVDVAAAAVETDANALSAAAATLSDAESTWQLVREHRLNRDRCDILQEASDELQKQQEQLAELSQTLEGVEGTLAARQASEDAARDAQQTELGQAHRAARERLLKTQAREEALREALDLANQALRTTQDQAKRSRLAAQGAAEDLQRVNQRIHALQATIAETPARLLQEHIATHNYPIETHRKECSTRISGTISDDGQEQGITLLERASSTDKTWAAAPQVGLKGDELSWTQDESQLADLIDQKLARALSKELQVAVQELVERRLTEDGHGSAARRVDALLLGREHQRATDRDLADLAQQLFGATWSPRPAKS